MDFPRFNCDASLLSQEKPPDNYVFLRFCSPLKETSLLPVLEQDMTMYEMRALHGHVSLFSFILSHSLIHSLV